MWGEEDAFLFLNYSFLFYFIKSHYTNKKNMWTAGSQIVPSVLKRAFIAVTCLWALIFWLNIDSTQSETPLSPVSDVKQVIKYFKSGTRGDDPMGCKKEFLSVTQRWQQQGNLPTTSFYLKLHYWICCDNRVAGRISAVQSREFMREEGHEMKVKAPESGDDRQGCVKGRYPEDTTERWLK